MLEPPCEQFYVIILIAAAIYYCAFLCAMLPFFLYYTFSDSSHSGFTSFLHFHSLVTHLLKEDKYIMHPKCMRHQWRLMILFTHIFACMVEPVRVHSVLLSYMEFHSLETTQPTSINLTPPTFVLNPTGSPPMLQPYTAPQGYTTLASWKKFVFEVGYRRESVTRNLM